MDERTITATDFSRNLSDILNQVRYQNASFVIRRGTEDVARVAPVGPPARVSVRVVAEFLKSAPPLDPDDAAEFEEARERVRTTIRDPGDRWT